MTEHQRIEAEILRAARIGRRSYTRDQPPTQEQLRWIEAATELARTGKVRAEIHGTAIRRDLGPAVVDVLGITDAGDARLAELDAMGSTLRTIALQAQRHTAAWIATGVALLGIIAAVVVALIDE